MPTWAVGLAGCSFILIVLSTVPGPFLVPVLALLVGVVGMPHGGLDHRVGRGLLAPVVGGYWLFPFLLGYAGLMAAVLAGWVFAPVWALAGFVLLSAAHFGMAEESVDSVGRLAQGMLRGGMVVWVPALFHPAEFTQLLQWVVPYDLWPAELLFRQPVRLTLWLALAAVLCVEVTSPRASLVRVLGLTVLFALAPPLVSFAVYFCGWHSTVELARLARQADPDNPGVGLRKVILAAAPLSLMASILVMLGWLAVESSRPLTPGLVQALFVGLSVVAVPHVILQVIAERRKINPFGTERPS
ncbi:MAG: Brp/Blh family beta-carotene 15,15'-dioxygenase [Gemmataceae bacterium]